MENNQKCVYLSVWYNCCWIEDDIGNKGLRVIPGTYKNKDYKKCIVVPENEYDRLDEAILKIKNVFRKSEYLPLSDFTSKKKYYWVTCNTQSDIKTIHVKDGYGKLPDKLPYSCNSFATKEIAENVVNDIKNILLELNLWR